METKSLNKVFKSRIFRVPDYQRGYAWTHSQLKDFWEDLVNLTDDRKHYTGVLTLKPIPETSVPADSKEHWLVHDLSHDLFHVVDGQQRLTTSMILIQAFIDFVSNVPENHALPENELFLTESMTAAMAREQYIFRTKPSGDQFRTYLFGYDENNPSYRFLRHRVFGEEGGGTIEESFYTRNLEVAKVYFREQLENYHRENGLSAVQDLFRRLTNSFLFNEYEIPDEFDLFVTFETMNNRGKKLSNLELLKNRLIYLTTLYSQDELDDASRRSLRETINEGWMEVYRQLGRNMNHPLNDDEFLRSHWIMYYKYSRKTGRDYIRFLLEDQFSPKRVLRKVERPLQFEVPEEVESDDSIDDEDEIEPIDDVAPVSIREAELEPREIRDYVHSLHESVVHWFFTFFPEFSEDLGDADRLWIDRLNRVGMVYFRPLVMAVLKKGWSEDDRVRVFREIERFIFLDFRVNRARATHGSSDFYNMARAVDRNEATPDTIVDKLHERLSYAFNDDGSFRTNSFYDALFKLFKEGSGYYGWSGLRYFLYEYELSLLTGSRQKKVSWRDLLKPGKDRITIEHIFPQSPGSDWDDAFGHLSNRARSRYCGTLGNLLLLSQSINSSLQNDAFSSKKHPKFNEDGIKTRNGYSDGSHSEIEVAQLDSWGPEEIHHRGLRLIDFLADRWNIRFANDQEKERLLFLEEYGGSST